MLSAASSTEKARYGLHAGSGARYSRRVELLLPGLVTGTRTRAVRFFRPQETCTGASNWVWLPTPEPWMSRL